MTEPTRKLFNSPVDFIISDGESVIIVARDGTIKFYTQKWRRFYGPDDEENDMLRYRPHKLAKKPDERVISGRIRKGDFSRYNARPIRYVDYIVTITFNTHRFSECVVGDGGFGFSQPRIFPVDSSTVPTTYNNKRYFRQTGTTVNFYDERTEQTRDFPIPFDKPILFTEVFGWGLMTLYQDGVLTYRDRKRMIVRDNNLLFHKIDEELPEKSGDVNHDLFSTLAVAYNYALFSPMGTKMFYRLNYNKEERSIKTNSAIIEEDYGNITIIHIFKKGSAYVGTDKGEFFVMQHSTD